MVIHKILNNNLILSRDGQGHEVIVKGCGIAFQKKKGQQVEESRIEKIFTAENAQISKEIQGYLTAIPEKYLDFVEAFVNEVKEKEGMKLNDSIYFSLSDHIMGAISRLENGIRLQNMLLLDIKQLYHKEYEIGLELLKKVNEMFEVDLSADEAGFFALHFVNAEDGGKTDSYQISIIVHQILDIVEKYYDNMEFQEDHRACSVWCYTETEKTGCSSFHSSRNRWYRRRTSSGFSLHCTELYHGDPGVYR